MITNNRSSYLLSQYFLPTLKDSPSEASIVSHKLMLKSGMIRQLASGIYVWMPLGLSVLQKVCDIVRSELNSEGFNEIIMPTIQPQELWDASGRGSYCGNETLQIVDRHNVKYIYGPTAEEVVTFIMKEAQSYKTLPSTLYNIQWKFRDEIRPRFGVMRAREFLMMDSYSFDVDENSGIEAYNKHYDAYLRIFARIGLVAVPMSAETGEIGGNLSHEFHIIADTGESEIHYAKGLDNVINNIKSGAISKNLRGEIAKYKAFTSERLESDKQSLDNCVVRRGIEVGHIFSFGTKYTKAMNCTVQGIDGKPFFPYCGSYGIGVGRLVAAFIEANHDENGIIWHESISPFDFILLNLSPKDDQVKQYAQNIYQELRQKFSILYDDTAAQAGEKFARADLVGITKQLIVSKKLLEAGNIEIKDRRTGEVSVVKLEELLAM